MVEVREHLILAVKDGDNGRPFLLRLAMKMLHIVFVVGRMMDNRLGIFVLAVNPQPKCIHHEG